MGPPRRPADAALERLSASPGRRRALLLAVVVTCAVGCQQPPPPLASARWSGVWLSLPSLPLWSAPLYDTLDPELEPLEAPQTVGDLIAARGCSTGATTPLNAQLAAEINCALPGAFTFFGDVPNIVLEDGANPFMQSGAAHALMEAAGARWFAPLTLTSTWRSPVQQHILKRWEGSCGVSLAAPPGRSLHESGQAIDMPLESIYEFHPELTQAGWRWFCDVTNRGFTHGCRDIPHYSHPAGDDMRRQGVLAFQRLWNHAHPEAPLPESGLFDARTARAVERAPLAGFDAGPSCHSPAEALCPVIFVDVPRRNDDWAAVEGGVMAGLWGPCDPQDPRRFCPSQGVTRAELARAMARALELPLHSAEGVFADVPPEHPDAPAIEALAMADVTLGCAPDGDRFCPEAPVTWGQLAAWLGRAWNLALPHPAGHFQDTPADHWAAPFAEAIARAGLMRGCRPGARFCPDWRLSRVRMARFMARAFTLPRPAPCLSWSESPALEDDEELPDDQAPEGVAPPQNAPRP